MWSDPSSDCRRELLGIKNYKPSARKFDDRDFLENEQEYRISSLTFKYFEEHILELVTEYTTMGK